MARIASRPGEAAGGAANGTELFLKKYAGEVLEAFERYSVMLSRHLVRVHMALTSGTLPNLLGGMS
jgi:hypothetical protein